MAGWSRPRVPGPYNQGIFTNDGGGYPCVASRPILWKLLTARLLCRTVYNPRDPAVNIRNTLCICCVAQRNSAPDDPPPFGGGNFEWKFIPVTPAFFFLFSFFFFLRVSRAFLRFLWALPAPYGVITHPIKQHAIDRHALPLGTQNH